MICLQSCEEKIIALLFYYRNAQAVKLRPTQIRVKSLTKWQRKKTEILVEKGYFLMNSIGDHFPVF